MTVKTIFSTEGEQYFRDKERSFLKNLNINDYMIVATGEGMPCFFDNMQIMLRKGVCIYLNRDKKLVIDRLLKHKERRPLIAAMNGEELEKYYDIKLRNVSLIISYHYYMPAMPMHKR